MANERLTDDQLEALFIDGVKGDTEKKEDGSKTFWMPFNEGQGLYDAPSWREPETPDKGFVSPDGFTEEQLEAFFTKVPSEESQGDYLSSDEISTLGR